jgi:sialate O-acetylesterase
MTRWFLLAAALVIPAAPALADVKLHPLFTDNMVLQRDAKVAVWGSADPGEAIEVTFRGGSDANSPTVIQKTTAGPDGQWNVSIDSGTATSEAVFTVKGKNEIALKNVAVGDVWVCSGQSNMAWRLAQLGREDQGKKVAAAATNKNLRLFTVPNRPFNQPQQTIPASKNDSLWLECNPETVINFSAVGYFFGRDIAASQKVPVGLISTNWGGTPCEAWTSKAGLEAEPELKHYVEAAMMAAYEKAMTAYKAAAEKAKAEGKPAPKPPTKPTNGGVNQNFPSALYNGMIAPIQKFKIKGAIWYQGESNASRAKEYRTLFPAMIKDWRKQWGDEIPFFAVQLAPYRADGSDKVSYAELRDAQTFATKSLPKVGMAVITDVGEETDIHPQRKEPVGARLALAARAIAYGESIEYSGPSFKAATFEGNQAIVTFDHIGGGLKADGDTLHGFTLAGDDKVFHAAKAVIKGDTVVVTCDAVAKPVAVRFGWINFAKPTLNFFNKAGLPAVPFRSDDFPLTTK